MIDPTLTAPPPPKRAVRLPPEGPGGVRYPVLAVVFVCAACGLVYELELVALASYLIGDSVTQASVVLSVMVFAMGVGSLLAKRLRCRPAVGFGLVECGLALIGGCSAMVLYAAFAWLGEARYVLVAFSLAIGVLVGAEIPLLMSLIQRAESKRGGRREQDAAGTVADLFAADYVGALVGGLAFPFLLLPWLGQLTGALVTGAVNAVAGGGLVLWLFRRDLAARSRLLLVGVNVAVLAVLATATVLAEDFEAAARRAVYGADVRVAVRTSLQEVVVTGGRGGPPDLFLDGRLRVGGRDEYRYHEALVHPAMNGRRARVLILGGGDGLAAREVLRYPDVRAVTVVELDPGVVRLARTDPGLAALNGQAFRDPRVTVAYGDAFRWLRESRPVQERYDVVICDLPDPGLTAGAKLYSEEFYGLVAGALADGGRLVVHAGSATARPRTYWTVDATLRAAGFATRPYGAGGSEHAGTDSGSGSGTDSGTGSGTGSGSGSRPGSGPSSLAGSGHVAGSVAGSGSGPGRRVDAPGQWSFLLAAPAPRRPALALAPTVPRLRSLTSRSLASAGARTERTRGGAEAGLPPSTLVHPRY
ncbi:polyamine aminopropyltransferase [Streptomyces sp. NPDC020422]|uniref:polyamine aminopropyltransferase n=1 Tax=Streptomyces sp. NPDC020422 TaxID=3365074 RepID=UPI00378E8C5B